MQLIFRRHHARQRELRAERAAKYQQLADALARVQLLDELEQAESPLPDPALAHNAHERRKLESHRRAAERGAYEAQFNALELERPSPDFEPTPEPQPEPSPIDPPPERPLGPPPPPLPETPEEPLPVRPLPERPLPELAQHESRKKRR